MSQKRKRNNSTQGVSRLNLSDLLLAPRTPMEEPEEEYAPYTPAPGRAPAESYTEEDEAAYQDALQGATGEELTLGSIAEGAAEIAGKTFDYPGGVTRAIAANLADLVTPSDAPELGRMEDIINAVLADPISGKKILERAGVPEGGSLSDALPGLYSESGEGMPLEKGGLLDPTGRGAAGFALETALDPLNWMTFGGWTGAKQAAKALGKKQFKEAAKAVRPRPFLAAKAKVGGKARYRQAFNKMDEIAIQNKKRPPSSIFIKQKKVANKKEASRHTGKLLRSLGKEREELLELATAAEGVAPVGQGYQNLAKEISEEMTDVRIPKQRRKYEPILDEFKESAEATTPMAGRPKTTIKKKWELGEPLKPYYIRKELPEIKEILPVTPIQANKAKVGQYSTISPKDVAKQTPVTKAQAFKEAKMLRKATEDSVEVLGDKATRRLKDLNRDMGSLLGMSKKLDSEAVSEVARPFVSQVDMMLAGMTKGYSLAAKKALQIGRLPKLQTGIGSGLLRGSKALEDFTRALEKMGIPKEAQALGMAAAREAIVPATRGEENPWDY